MKIITQLKESRDETLKFFELPNDLLKKQYAEGKWNIRQLLHHLADAETVLYDRVRRAIAKPNQVIWAFDQDAWAEKLDYQNCDLEINRNIYKAVRASVIQLAEIHYENADQVKFIHSETGQRTLKDEFDKIALHNFHHLEQIKQAFEK